MEIFDIEEFDKPDFNLVAWLKAFGPEVGQRFAAWIATRISARALPVLMEGLTHSAKAKDQVIDDPRIVLVLRCLLTSGVGAFSLTLHIRKSAYEADMALSQLDHADGFWIKFLSYSAALAVRTVNARTGVGDTVLDRAIQNANEAKEYVEAGIDDKLDTGVEVVKLGYPSPSVAQPVLNTLMDQIEADTQISGEKYWMPLWSGTPPDWFLATDKQMRKVWASDPNENWNFWIRWWDGLVAGQPLDWALQEKVALIPDVIWQQGAAAVARAIRDIEEAMTPPEPSDTDMEKVIEQTRHGAVLFYDPDTKLIGEEAVSTLPQDVRRDVVDLMQDVLSGFPAASAGNNIYELIHRERDILKRAIDAYGARPWMLLTSLRRARAGVQDKVADGTCPQNDPLLNDLVAQIVQAEVLLINHDAELAVAVRNQERLPDATLTAEDLHLLTAGMQALQGHATPELSIVIEADLAAIADTNLPIPHRKAAMLSTIARLVQVRALATGTAKRSLFGNSRFGVAEVASWVTIFDGIARVLTASGAWEWILVVIQRLL